jgi:hypothetical protein
MVKLLLKKLHLVAIRGEEFETIIHNFAHIFLLGMEHDFLRVFLLMHDLIDLLERSVRFMRNTWL